MLCTEISSFKDFCFFFKEKILGRQGLKEFITLRAIIQEIRESSLKLRNSQVTTRRHETLNSLLKANTQSIQNTLILLVFVFEIESHTLVQVGPDKLVEILCNPLK